MAGATQLLDEDLDLQYHEGIGNDTAKQTVGYLDLIPSLDGHVSSSFPLKIGRNVIGRLAQKEPTSDEEEQDDANKVLIDKPSISLEHAEIILQEYRPDGGVLPSHAFQVGGDEGTILDLNTIVLIDQKSTNKTHISDTLEHLGIRCPPRIPKPLKHNQFISFGDAKTRFRIVGMEPATGEANSKRPTPTVDNDSTQEYGLQEEATLPYEEPEKTLAYGNNDDLYGSATGGSVEREESEIPAPSPPKPTPAAASASAAPSSSPRPPPAASDATQACSSENQEMYDADEKAPSAAAGASAAPSAAKVSEATQAFPADGGEDVNMDADGAHTQVYGDSAEGEAEATLAYPNEETIEATLAYPVSPTFSSTPNSSARPSPAASGRGSRAAAASSSPAVQKDRPVSPVAATLAYPAEAEDDPMDEADEKRTSPPPAKFEAPAAATASVATPTASTLASSLPAPSIPNAGARVISPDFSGTPDGEDEEEEAADGPGDSHCSPPPVTMPQSISIPPTVTHPLPPTFIPDSAKPTRTQSKSGIATASLPKEDGATLSYQLATHKSNPPAAASAAAATSGTPPAPLSATPPTIPAPRGDETPSLELELTLDAVEADEVAHPVAEHPVPAAASSANAPPAKQAEPDADGDIEMADADAPVASSHTAAAPLRSVSNLSAASASSNASAIPAWNSKRKKPEDMVASPAASPATPKATSNETAPTAAATSKSAKPLTAQELKQQKFAQKAAEKARKDAEREAKKAGSTVDSSQIPRASAAASSTHPVASATNTVVESEDMAVETLPPPLPAPTKRLSRGASAKAKQQEAEKVENKKESPPVSVSKRKVAAPVATSPEKQSDASKDADSNPAPTESVAPAPAAASGRSKSSAASRRRAGRASQVEEDAAAAAVSDEIAPAGPSEASKPVEPAVVKSDSEAKPVTAKLIPKTEDVAPAPVASASKRGGRRSRSGADTEEPETQPMDTDEAHAAAPAVAEPPVEPKRRGRAAVKQAAAPEAAKVEPVAAPAKVGEKVDDNPASAARPSRKRGASQISEEEKPAVAAEEPKAEEDRPAKRGKKAAAAKVEETPAAAEAVAPTPAAPASRSSRRGAACSAVEPPAAATSSAVPMDVSATPAAGVVSSPKSTRGKRKAEPIEEKQPEEAKPAQEEKADESRSKKKARGGSKASATDAMEDVEPAPGAAAASSSAVPVIRHPQLILTGISPTVHIGESYESDITKLRGTIIDDVLHCTHLVTDRVRRTEKFLTAYSICPFIVHHSWARRFDQERRISARREIFAYG
jgi:hypothetical protein